MNNFKENLKVSREASGEIVVRDKVKELFIELLKGNISKKELMGITGIGDKNTVEIKLQELVAQNPELTPLYEEYVSRKNANFEGYSFRAEAVIMLRSDYSQSEMAKKIGISRRSFSTKMKKLAENNQDNVLGQLLVEHADRKMKRQKTLPEEMIMINLKLDGYEEEFPIGLARYEKKSAIESRLDNIAKTLYTVEELLEQGYTLKQLDEQGVISESMYRKYREERANISKILESKIREEE